MMIRKLMLLIAAVLAPLAFAGATADYTRAWVRRWIEFVAAMIVSKLLLVIILSIGVSVLNGAGQAGPAPTQGVTQLAAGSLILLMGGFAPWVAIRMFSFAGDTLYAAHASAGHAASGARAVASTPQKVATMQWHARTLIPSGRGGTGAAPARVSPALYGSPRPPTWWGAGAGSTGRATAGAAGTGGGAAAATAAAAPAIAALAAGQVVKGVVNKGIGAATAANDTAHGAGRESGPVERSDPPPSTRRPPKQP